MQYNNGDDVQLILKTNKDSQTGLFSNQRLLLIKAGIVSYFSSIPAKFMGSARAIQLSGQMPKFAIPADQISKVQLKQGTLSLLILKNRLISRQQFALLAKGQQSAAQKLGSQSKSTLGYQQWIFRCQNEQVMKQFYRLVNLFRTGNQKFKPNMNRFIQGFQTNKKSSGKRQMSLQPNQYLKKNHHSNNNNNQNRFSEVPNSNNDIFSDIIKKNAENKQVSAPEPIKIPVQYKEENKRKSLTKDKEGDRVSKVINRFSNIGDKFLGIIEEGQNQDKSEASKALSITFPRQSRIQIVEQWNQPEIVKKIKKTQQPKKEEIKPEQVKVQPVVLQQIKKEQIKQQKVQEIKVNQEQNNLKPTKIQEIVKFQEPQIQKNQPKIDSITSIQLITINLASAGSIIQQPPSTSNAQKPFTASNIQLPQVKQQAKINKTKVKQVKRYQRIEYFQSFSQLEQNSVVLLKKQKKLNKISNLIKSMLIINNNDNAYIAKLLGITQEDLLKILISGITEQQSLWIQLESKLNELLIKKQIKEIDINIDIKQKMNEFKIQQMYQQNDNTQNKNESTSFFNLFKTHIQNYYTNKKQIVLNYNNNQYKFQIKPLKYSKEQIYFYRDNFLCCKGGYLQQFLAYLKLNRIIQSYQNKINHDIQILCVESFYFRYKQYQAISKEWKPVSIFYPLKSIRALQFIAHSKKFKIFEQQFPQFNIVIQIVQDNKIYKFHLQRTNKEGCEDIIKKQLKKFTILHENELDLFIQSESYKKTQQQCLNTVNKLLKQNKSITKQLIYQMLQQFDNNFKVNIFCKLINAHINKNGQIFFDHFILKSHQRQIGEQLSLIKRIKKKGNIQISKQLSQNLMQKLSFYSQFIPSNFYIQYSLQAVSLSIQHQNLQLSIASLHKLLLNLGQYEIQQYSVYCNLMQAYLKLENVDGFVRTLQNCRIFLKRMFGNNSVFFDYPLQRLILKILLHINHENVQKIAKNIIANLDKQNINNLNVETYKSKATWDYCNILLKNNKYEQAYETCLSRIQFEQNKQNFIINNLVQGLLCLVKIILVSNKINEQIAFYIEQRIQLTLGISIQRQLFKSSYLLLEYGRKIIQLCKENNIPTILEHQTNFKQIQFIYLNTREDIIKSFTNQPLF